MFKSLFKLFRKTAGPTLKASAFVSLSEPESEYKDHLGAAVEARKLAEQYIRESNYNEAWRYLCIAKDEFVNHAGKNNFTFDQLIALDATIAELMADVLRREGRHIPALVHIVYWVIAGARVNKRIKRHGDKFKAYFGRCNLKDISLAEAWLDVQSVGEGHAYTVAEELVKQWSGFEGS